MFIEEQRQVADLLWLVHDGMLASEKKGAALKDLFKTLLHKLMTGEIRLADLDLSAFIRRTDRPGDI